MPKQKTHKGAQKRIQFSGKRKLLRLAAGGSHLLEKKRSSSKRKYYKKTEIASKQQVKVLRKMLGKTK